MNREIHPAVLVKIEEKDIMLYYAYGKCIITDVKSESEVMEAYNLIQERLDTYKKCY